MSNRDCKTGLDDRCRDRDGEIRQKRGDTRVGTLRETYGADFAPGVRSDTRLDGERPSMADVLVTCINKQPRDDPYEGITHLGNPDAGWKWSRQQVISSINEGTNTFYTPVGDKRANIAVVEGKHGPYLRTHADGYWNDNLLALPECS